MSGAHCKLTLEKPLPCHHPSEVLEQVQWCLARSRCSVTISGFSGSKELVSPSSVVHVFWGTLILKRRSKTFCILPISDVHSLDHSRGTAGTAGLSPAGQQPSTVWLHSICFVMVAILKILHNWYTQKILICGSILYITVNCFIMKCHLFKSWIPKSAKFITLEVFFGLQLGLSFSPAEIFLQVTVVKKEW